MTKNYVVKARVQAMAKDLNMRISGEAIIIIDTRVQDLIRMAAKRAKANRRKTIKAQDF